MLLDFINIGGAELAIILAAIALPFLLIVYCVVDITRSKFKTPLHKVLFLLLVIFAPFIGSIIYLIMKKEVTTHKLPERF